MLEKMYYWYTPIECGGPLAVTSCLMMRKYCNEGVDIALGVSCCNLDKDVFKKEIGRKLAFERSQGALTIMQDFDIFMHQPDITRMTFDVIGNDVRYRKATLWNPKFIGMVCSILAEEESMPAYLKRHIKHFVNSSYNDILKERAQREENRLHRLRQKEERVKRLEIVSANNDD